MRLAIIGAGLFGELIAHQACNDSGFTIAGYYDDFSIKKDVNGNPVLGKCDKILQDYQQDVFDGIIIGIGYDHMEAREKYYYMFKDLVPFVNVIHSSCHIDPSCTLGKGIYMFAGNVLDSYVKVDDNVIIANGGTISHHSKVERHTIISAAVSIAGLVTINECCFIGIGATIVDRVNIARGSVIGAGSVVLKDTEENSVSMGVPAKTVKFTDRVSHSCNIYS